METMRDNTTDVGDVGIGMPLNPQTLLFILAVVVGLFAPAFTPKGEAEEFSITEGYEERPDEDPFHYFPTRPSLRQGMREMAQDIRGLGTISRPLLDMLLDELNVELTSTTQFFAVNIAKAALYDAAIDSADCRLAEDLVWEQLIEERPFLVGLREDSFFSRALLRELFTVHFPELASCLYARQVRTLSQMIANHSQNTVGSDDLIRPFVAHHSWLSARGTLHGMRDHDIWELVEMSAYPHRANYGPAGVMLVELALTLDSINLPGAVLYMLLLRAEATWPDHDRGVPIRRSRIDALMPLVTAPLLPDEMERAERCFMSNEPYNRLFLGEEDHSSLPDDEQCAN